MNSPLKVIEREMQNAERTSVCTEGLDAIYVGLAQFALDSCQAALSSIVVIDDARIWCRRGTLRQSHAAPPNDPFFDLTARTRDFIEIIEPEFDANCRCFLIDENQTQVRSYAGYAVRTERGNLLGALGVYYLYPHRLVPSQKAALRLLAKQLAEQVHLRVQLTDLLLQSCVSQLPAMMSAPTIATQAPEELACTQGVDAPSNSAVGASSAEKKEADSQAVSIVRAGKHFTGHYLVVDGTIRVTHEFKTRATRLGGAPAQVVARQVLYDMVGSLL